jgi:hypothetical protein
MLVGIFVRILRLRSAARAAAIAGRTETCQAAERAADDHPNQQQVQNGLEHAEFPLPRIIFEPPRFGKLNYGVISGPFTRSAAVYGPDHRAKSTNCVVLSASCRQDKYFRCLQLDRVSF